MGLINKGKQPLFQLLTFRRCILNKSLMVLNSLIDFCFDGGESKHINNYGANWVKNIKDNVIYLKTQQIKKVVSYLLFNCYFTIGPKVFYQMNGIPMGSGPAPFFANVLLK